jgi:2',3'-cyclic-nucleotide 2'-phosphodiesterase (5'-nucleotidase family)
MRRLLSPVLAAVTALSLPLTALAEELVIVHTNDTHNHLTTYKDRDGSLVGGTSHRASFVSNEKKSHANVLVLDAGDIFQGTPLYTFFKGEVDIKAMSLVGYDAAAMGNHDLDDGWDNLKRQLKFAQFPMLCANVTTSAGAPVLLPAMTFVRGSTRIGVVSLLGDGAWQNVAVKSRAGLKQEAIIPAAKRWVATLRDQVDLMVLLTHNGRDEDVELAKAVPGVDVIVGGHSHTPLKEPIFVKNGNTNGVGGTVILQAGCYGKYAGRLTLDVEKGRLNSYKGELIAMDGNVPVASNAIDGLIAPYAAQLDKQMNEVIGACPTGLATGGKYGGETPLGNWLADMLREEGKADVGIINSGGIRAELPAGPVTVGKIFEILPFENFLSTVDLPGQNLIDLAAAVADRLHNHKPGTMQFSGLSFKMKAGKLSGPVLIGGKPVDPKHKYRVSVVDYILGGGEGPFFEARTNETKSDALLRDLMIRRVKAQQTVGIPASGRIVHDEPAAVPAGQR